MDARKAVNNLQLGANFLERPSLEMTLEVVEDTGQKSKTHLFVFNIFKIISSSYLIIQVK